MSNIENAIKIAREKAPAYTEDFETIEGVWGKFSDLKVRWTRMGGFISFTICDYLQDATDEMLADILANIFKKIRGELDAVYSAETIDWLTSDEFIARNRATYIARHGQFEQSSRLTWALKRLKAKGLVQGDGFSIGFGHVPGDGQGSCLFKTVIVSDRLKDAPKDLLDFVLYKHLKVSEAIGFTVPPEERSAMAEQITQAYPRWSDLSMQALALCEGDEDY